MAAVIAFIVKKGGVGKSAWRGRSRRSVEAGLEVVLADLDPRQQTLLPLEESARRPAGLTASVGKRFDDAAEAVERADACDLLILDAPGGVNDDTPRSHARRISSCSRRAHVDDLYPTVLLFHELVDAGIPKSHLVAALCRVLDKEEEADARAYLEEAAMRCWLASFRKTLRIAPPIIADGR